MKNNNITKDVESIEALEKEIKWLKNELHWLMNERNALAKINQQLQDKLETLRNDNLQLIEQIALKHDNTTCQYRMIRSEAITVTDDPILDKSAIVFHPSSYKARKFGGNK